LHEKFGTLRLPRTGLTPEHKIHTCKYAVDQQMQRPLITVIVCDHPAYAVAYKARGLANTYAYPRYRSRIMDYTDAQFTRIRLKDFVRAVELLIDTIGNIVRERVYKLLRHDVIDAVSAAL
jgi:hypothetical protein